MRSWIVGLAILSSSIISTAQAPSTYKAPRSPFKDGKPDLNGIWQANNTANWNLEDHAARSGRRRHGPLGAIPAASASSRGEVRISLGRDEKEGKRRQLDSNDPNQ